jgi:hypothetical protein
VPARATWKGFLRLSLVNIPIRVFSATESSGSIGFNHDRDAGWDATPFSETPVYASAASLPVCPAYASEKIVSRKPLGSLTSNARLFHSVS